MWASAGSRRDRGPPGGAAHGRRGTAPDADQPRARAGSATGPGTPHPPPPDTHAGAAARRLQWGIGGRHAGCGWKQRPRRVRARMARRAQVHAWARRTEERMPRRMYATAAEKQAAYRLRAALRNETNVTPLVLPCGDDTPDDSYTPRYVLTAARAALGTIDLDPASSARAQAVVHAATWAGLDHPDPERRNGLLIPWVGRVWCNPPFSDGNLLRFTEQLLTAYHAGDVTAACILTLSDCSTQYSQLLRMAATASCWPARRINFHQPGKRGGNPNRPTLIWYLGSSPGRFVAAFSAIGDTR